MESQTTIVRPQRSAGTYSRAASHKQCSTMFNNFNVVSLTLLGLFLGIYWVVQSIRQKVVSVENSAKIHRIWIANGVLYRASYNASPKVLIKLFLLKKIHRSFPGKRPGRNSLRAIRWNRNRRAFRPNGKLEFQSTSSSITAISDQMVNSSDHCWNDFLFRHFVTVILSSQ